MLAGQLFRLSIAILFMQLLVGCIFTLEPPAGEPEAQPHIEDVQHSAIMGSDAFKASQRPVGHSGVKEAKEFHRGSTGQNVMGPSTATLTGISGVRGVVMAYSRLTWSGVLWRYFLFQLLFLTFLYVLENVRDLIFTRPRVLRLSSSYITDKPPRVDRTIALSYDTPWCLYEVLKTTFFMITGLLVLRLVIFVLFTFVTLATMSIAGWRGRNRYDNPWWFSCFYLIAHNAFCAASVGIGFYNFRVFGLIADRTECKILIANHSCIFEVALLFSLARCPSFVTRKENNMPFLDTIMNLSDCILVDRSAKESRRLTAEAVMRRAKDRNPTAPQLVIFPEGTTANQRALFMFRKGAMEPGEPVQMICVGFPYKNFNPCWNGRCCGGNSFPILLLRLCSQFVNRVEVRPLPVYTPTEAEQVDPILYANHCQEMMANVLGCGVSECTYSDYVALQNAKQAPPLESAK